MTAKDVFFIGFMFLIIGLIFILFFSFEMHRFSGNLERYEDISLYYQLSFFSVYFGIGIMLIGIFTRVSEGIFILKNMLNKSDSSTIGMLTQNEKYVIKVVDVDPIQEEITKGNETQEVRKKDDDGLVEM